MNMEWWYWFFFIAAMTNLGFWIGLVVAGFKLSKEWGDAKMNTNFEDVRDFHVKFEQLVPSEVSHLTWRKLEERFNFMCEELEEFRSAAIDQNMPKMFDALLDLVYVAMGTAVMMGLPWQEGWNEIQRANMAKVRGKTHRVGASNDVCKPPGWIGPDHKTILDRHQYEFLEWFPEDDVSDETQCLDDIQPEEVTDISVPSHHQQAFPRMK